MANSILLTAQGDPHSTLCSYWAEAENAGLEVTLLAPMSIASLHVRKGQEADLVKAISKNYAADLMQGPHTTEGKSASFLGTGPGAWLAIWPNYVPAEIITLRDHTSSLASISDQSSAYKVFKISGSNTNTLLARGLAVDIGSREFETGVVCAAIAHIGVTVWRVDDAPTVMIAVARSYSESFAHWLMEAISGVVQDS